MSPTAVNTYLSCPRKYYLRYIKRHKTKPSIHLVRGLIVHQALHEFNKNQPKILHGLPKEMIEQELLNNFKMKWRQAESSLNSLGLSEDELRFYHDDSRKMMINFSNWFSRPDTSPAVSCELKIFSNSMRVMGIIDAVHESGDEVYLVDYKTSKHAKITSDIMRQAAIYALLYKDRYGKAPDEVRIHFLKDTGDPQSIGIDEETLEYGKILIESTRKNTQSMDEESYPCKCGGYCERDFVQNGTG